MFITYQQQLLFGNIVGFVLVALAACFWGKRLAVIATLLGVLALLVYFIEAAWPIEPRALRWEAIGIGFNLLVFGAIWLVVARLAVLLGTWASKRVRPASRGP